MLGQMDMFAVAATKANDPITSGKAERKITRSGKRQSHAKKVHAIVRAFPGQTSHELAIIVGDELSYMQIVRRLSDLKNAKHVRQGDARTCRVSGSECVEWYSFDA